MKFAIITLRLCAEADTEGGSSEEIAKEIEHILQTGETVLPWQGSVVKVVVVEKPEEASVD